ncbi:MAG: MOSC domain-containing protein [Rhodobacter sp.]|jgi:hypothetical protein|nr:MOSC domain-containing protein [Rhodobacter sp.]
MTALVPTDFTARVVWLGAQEVPVKDLVITATPVAEMQLTFAGFGPETHAGLTRPSCSRVLKQHPRDTEIRNTRQLCVVSAEEIAEVAADLGLADFDYAWVGASLVLEGISDLTHLPPSSRLQGPDGVTLVVDMLNEPCQEPAVTIARATGGRGKAFKTAATGKRGVTAWVERPGTLRLGDEMRLHIPGQRAWSQLAPAPPR